MLMARLIRRSTNHNNIELPTLPAPHASPEFIKVMHLDHIVRVKEIISECLLCQSLLPCRLPLTDRLTQSLHLPGRSVMDGSKWIDRHVQHKQLVQTPLAIAGNESSDHQRHQRGVFIGC